MAKVTKLSRAMFPVTYAKKNKEGLRGCPFCGSMDLFVPPEWDTTIFYVECSGNRCRVFGPTRRTRKAAIAAWNRRVLR